MATTKVFKSGNSMAVRLPASFKAVAGTPVEVRDVQGKWIVEPIDAPKRKFNIAKIAGSATNLAYIAEEDRVIEERSLDWPTPADGDGGR